jgi:hypothetical protein
MLGTRFALSVLIALVLAVSVSTSASAEPTTTTDAGALAAALARPWPSLQQPDGRFRDYMSGAADGVGRYGEAMLGLGLLRAGLRASDAAAVDAGLLALQTVLADPARQLEEPSVFELFAVANGYNLARTRLAEDPRVIAMLPSWQAWLAAQRPIQLRRGLRAVWNKSIVEAAAVLELLRTGVRSGSAHTWLHDRRATRARIARIVNRRIPKDAPISGRRAMLGDGPSYPLAYHALSLGFYAHAVQLLGADAAPAARRVLTQAARTSLMLTAPDGDLAYAGRSQEQAWALAFTVYGARAAARHARGRTAPSLAQLSSLVLTRLATRHPVIDGGLAIVPAFASGARPWYPGIDEYAGAAAYGGLTIVALDLAADLDADGRPVQSVARRAVAKVVSAEAGEMAILHRGPVWIAVKRARTGSDLRYDFGLVALKRQLGDAWQDVLPLRPRAVGPSLGPTLIRAGVEHEPRGRRIEVDDTAIRIAGGFRGARGRVAFDYVPTCCGVVLRFRGRPGATYRYSTFFPAAAAPRALDDRAVVGAGRSLRVSAPAELTLGGATARRPRRTSCEPT